MKIRMKGKKKAEILIYEDIGDGWLGGLSAKAFAKEVKSLGKLDEINVRINSPGGSVFDGIAIHNTLVKNSARIVVDIDGLAASIASVIAMSGDEVNMAANSMFMVHDPWIVAAGSASELREQADLLDKVRDQLIATYVGRSNAETDDVSALMAAETWMNAEEALEHGFVDNITSELKIAAHYDKEIMNKFKNTPDSLAALMVESESEFVPGPAHARIRLMQTSLKARQL